MKANAMTFDLGALSQPKDLGDIIALAKEAREEMRRINDHLDTAFARCDEPVDA